MILNQPAKDFTTAGNASIPPYFGGKDKNLFKLLHNNSLKVVNENDEPIVVYHWKIINSQYSIVIGLGENKESPSKKLARTITLGHLGGTAASIQLSSDFDDHDVKVEKKSESAIMRHIYAPEL